LANARDLATDVELAAPFAEFYGKTPKQIAAAETEAKKGVDAAAEAANVAFFDASADADSAAAAEDDGDDTQAAAYAAAAGDEAVAAKASEQTALDGWAKVLSALQSLNPNEG
jgi:hypothetical protein